MTTTTFPGPLWFREILGGALILLVAFALFLPLALTSGPDVAFGLVAGVSGLGLGVFGGSVLLLGLHTRQKQNPDRD